MEALKPLALLLTGTAFGSMAFFSAVVAPLVFVKLPSDVAGRFIRALFPYYYLVLALLTGGAAAAAAPAHPFRAVVLGCVAAGFVYARLLLMPKINRLRDRELAGDATAGPAFARAHRASVWLNAAQLVLLAGVFWSAAA